jgi:aldose 1-epimerase
LGRFAGRINNGVFNLNGKSFLLNNNNPTLHGGDENFSQKFGRLKENINEGENPSITLSCLSPDGKKTIRDIYQ